MKSQTVRKQNDANWADAGIMKVFADCKTLKVIIIQIWADHIQEAAPHWSQA